MGAICIPDFGLYPLVFQSNSAMSESTYLQAASDLWESYDRIISLLLDFNDLTTRIKFLESVDQELLLGAVYMEAFEHLLKFIGILTRYVRDKDSSSSVPIELIHSELPEALDW